MNNSSAVFSDLNKQHLKKIAAAACLLAGTLDISAAMIDAWLRYRTGPVQLFQYIASGVFGPAAFSGGLPAAAAGLVFHYFIAGSWTLLFLLAYPKLRIPERYKFISGLLYGVIIWLVMNLVVVPLSRTHKPPFNWAHTIIGMLYLMFLIGLPVSLIYHKYFFNKNTVNKT